MNSTLLSLPLSFLACAALVGCASAPPTATPTALGYDLAIADDRVSLSFGRDLTVPEFLQLAQNVTGGVYVCHKDHAAAAGTVSLLGRIDCKRSAFPEFVTTMLYVRGLRAEAKGGGGQQYVEITPIPRTVGS